MKLRPCSLAACASSTESTPASTLAACAPASTSIPRMRSVLTRIVRSRAPGAPRAVAPCPVPCPATRRPFSAAKRTTAAMSSPLSTKATASGRWSAIRFQARRASSQSGSLGVAMRPAMDSPVKSLIGAPPSVS